MFDGFDCEEKLDVVLLYCPLPDKVAAKVTDSILGRGKTVTQNKWATLGFPNVNDFKAQDATGTFGVDQENPTISLTLTDTIDEAKLKANGIENGWGGMSGAPVFCIETNTLQAVITDHNQWMQKQLLGVSIPYLMRLPEFRAALGLKETDEQHKKYLAELPQRIIEQLGQLEKSSVFYPMLAKKFVPDGLSDTPENVWQGIKEQLAKDPISLLEQYRNTVAAALKKDPNPKSEAQALFLLLLGFFSKPTDITGSQIHPLPVRTRLAVEIYLAACFGLTPDLVYDPKPGQDVNQSARGRYAIDGEAAYREVGWDAKANAQELAKTVDIAVNKVHESVHGQKPADALDDFGLQALNETPKNPAAR